MKEEVREQLAEMLAGEMANNRGTVTIREGKAIELKEPVKVNISGTIDAPARWLEARHDCLTEKICHVLVDREAMTVSLRCNENDHYGTSVTAKHPEDWASSFMKEGKGFGPIDGRCWCCHQNIYAAEGREMIYSRRHWESTGRILQGISVEEARTRLTTGCPFCHRSYVD